MPRGSLRRRMARLPILVALSGDEMETVRFSRRRRGHGQTMTEYALILAAVAVVVFVTYEVMGQDITKLVTIIDRDLVNAS